MERSTGSHTCPGWPLLEVHRSVGYAGAWGCMLTVPDAQPVDVQHICPPNPIPAASEDDFQLCSANYGDAQLATTKMREQLFKACMRVAVGTKCEDTVVVDAAGSRIIPDSCLDYSGSRTMPAFSCPLTAASEPQYDYCATSARTAECGDRAELCCSDGGWVRHTPCLTGYTTSRKHATWCARADCQRLDHVNVDLHVAGWPGSTAGTAQHTRPRAARVIVHTL